MRNYAGFGFTIATDVALPDLRDAPGYATPDWTFRVADGDPPVGASTLLGSDTVYDVVQVRSFRRPDGLRLVFDDTGTFDVDTGTREIVWYAGRNATEAAARADLLGRVIAAAAHTDGRIVLHASAVSFDGLAIACLGPKRAGKSTLALALVRRGARLVTDDTLVIRLDERGVAWAAPGVQRLRLWDDSARALGAVTSTSSGAKPAIDCLTTAHLEATEVPLSACFVLRAAESEAAVSADGALRPPTRAALAYVQFSKLGALAGGTEAEVVLDRAARLARRVPVFDLAIRRDLAAVDDVAAWLLDQQRESAAAAEGAGR